MKQDELGEVLMYTGSMFGILLLAFFSIGFINPSQCGSGNCLTSSSFWLISSIILICIQLFLIGFVLNIDSKRSKRTGSGGKDAT